MGNENSTIKNFSVNHNLLHIISVLLILGLAVFAFLNSRKLDREVNELKVKNINFEIITEELHNEINDIKNQNITLADATTELVRRMHDLAEDVFYPSPYDFGTRHGISNNSFYHSRENEQKNLKVVDLKIRPPHDGNNISESLSGGIKDGYVDANWLIRISGYDEVTNHTAFDTI